MTNNGTNNWQVSYSIISFLETVLTTHKSVEGFTRKNDIQFIIERKDNLTAVNAVLVNEYVLGEAALYRIIKEFPDVDVIVNGGSWNEISFDWRELEKQTGVVAFLPKDFLGALHVNDLSKYITEKERNKKNNRK